eukprot:15476277-Alexandrium_andersonii.AAC.1
MEVARVVLKCLLGLLVQRLRVGEAVEVGVLVLEDELELVLQRHEGVHGLLDRLVLGAAGGGESRRVRRVTHRAPRDHGVVVLPTDVLQEDVGVAGRAKLRELVHAE